MEEKKKVKATKKVEEKNVEVEIGDKKAEINTETTTKNILNDVKDNSADYNKKEIEDGKLMAILSYIIPPIPYFVEKNNKFAQYHAKQGMNLFIISIAYMIVYTILTSAIKVNRVVGIWGYATTMKVTPWWVTFPLSLVSLAFGVIYIIGIINVLNGKAKELPVVGKIQILK